MRAGKAAIRAQRRPGCAAGSRIHITVHRKSGVLSGSLGFEPRLAQQLRYPLRRDRHFKDTDANRCQRIRNRVEYRRRRADRAALTDTLGAGDARLSERFQMMDFDARDFGCGRHGIVSKRAGQHVALVVINHLFIERVGDALGDAAMDFPSTIIGLIRRPASSTTTNRSIATWPVATSTSTTATWQAFEKVP